MTMQKNDEAKPAAKGEAKTRKSMTPEEAKERGLDPAPYGKPKGK